MRDKRKAFILIVVVVGILGGSIFAISKYRNREITCAKANGIIATVENVKTDKSTCIVEVSLKKEDQTAFEDGNRIGKDKISSHKTSLSWHKDIDLSKDKRILTYRFKVSPSNRQKLKRLEIDIDSLVNTVEGTKILEKSIYDLYEEYPLQYDYEQEIPMIISEEEDEENAAKAGVIHEVKGYEPLENVKDFRILGVGFSNNYDRAVKEGETKKKLLHIRTSQIDEMQGIKSTAWMYGLYNESTGEEIELIQGFTTPEINTRDKKVEEGGGLEISEDYFELTNTEKLKSIKPKVHYIERKITNSGKWSLKVNVKGNVKSLSKEVDLEINAAGIPIELNKIYISAIGAEIEGTVLDEDKFIKVRGVDVPVILHMNDGSKIKSRSISWSGEVEYLQGYEIPKTINVEDIKQIEVADKMVPIN